MMRQQKYQEHSKDIGSKTVHIVDKGCDTTASYFYRL